MTLHATRDGQRITIHGNTGVDVRIGNSQLHHASITEDAAHVRHFWGQLGNLLSEAEKETAEVVGEVAGEIAGELRIDLGDDPDGDAG